MIVDKYGEILTSPSGMITREGSSIQPYFLKIDNTAVHNMINNVTLHELSTFEIV
jgi:hypothetical protein